MERLPRGHRGDASLGDEAVVEENRHIVARQEQVVRIVRSLWCKQSKQQKPTDLNLSTPTANSRRFLSYRERISDTNNLSSHPPLLVVRIEKCLVRRLPVKLSSAQGSEHENGHRTVHTGTYLGLKVGGGFLGGDDVMRDFSGQLQNTDGELLRLSVGPEDDKHHEDMKHYANMNMNTTWQV